MKLIIEPDPRLHEAVAWSGICNRAKGAELWATMMDHRGIGLAGPQVGWMDRVICIYGYGILYNPVLLKERGGYARGDEWCLSLPGQVARVTRAKIVQVSFLRDSEERQEKLRGVTARCFLHEIDHLDGLLMVDL